MRDESDKSALRTAARARVLPGPRLLASVVAVIAMLLVLALVATGVAFLAGWRPSLNPFRDEAVDRTGPAVLKSLNDLSEYHAASGHYETVVDVENATPYVPDILSGERVLYVGKGDVDAVVDFGRLDQGRVVVSQDRTAVSIRLPAPTVDQPTLDLEHSYVANHEQGIVNRFKGSDLERQAQLKAVQQMTSAAVGSGDLADRARQNTTAMLRALFGAAGFTTVTVTFDEDPG